MESERPLPVVIVSSCWDPLEVERTFEAMAAGAVAILPKPANMAEDGGEYEQELLRTIRAASEARNVAMRPMSSISTSCPAGVRSRTVSSNASKRSIPEAARVFILVGVKGQTLRVVQRATNPLSGSGPHSQTIGVVDLRMNGVAHAAFVVAAAEHGGHRSDT